MVWDWLISPEGAAVAVLLTILAFIGIDAKSGWRILRWARRGFRPETPPVQPVQIVPAPPPAPAYPRIAPPDAGRKFVGREDELEGIRTKLEVQHGVQIAAARGVAVSAEGGRGKTALAIEYARIFGARYDGGAWLRAQSRQTLLQDIAALGNGAFQMPIPDRVTDAHAGAVLDRIAQTGARWLLVYDNVDDPQAVHDLIRKAPRVDVIVTTRHALAWDGWGRVDLGVLDTDTPHGAATELLLQEAGIPFADHAAQRNPAWQVAQALDGLPLALVLAGALVRIEGWPLSRLLTEIDTVLRSTPESPDYPNSVLCAVKLTYDRLGPDAQALADLCAWLAPDGVGEDVFAALPDAEAWSNLARPQVPPLARDVLEDGARLRDALRALRRWSVLTGDGAIHRLTQAALRAQQRAAGQDQAQAAGAAAVLAAQFPYDSDLVDHWPRCRALVPHVTALWAAAGPQWQGPWGRPGSAAMDYLLNQSGLYLSTQADLDAAITAKRASLELKQARLGADHRGIPTAMGNLALDLAETGALDAAEGLVARAVDLDERHRRGAARADLATRHMQQASVAIRRIEAGGPNAAAAADLAQTALDKARAIREDLFGADSEAMAEWWNNMGYLHRLLGRKGAELAAYQTALRLTRALPAPDRGTLATRTMNVGSTALELGRVDAAQVALQEAYDIATGIYVNAPQHPFLRTTADWLATCHMVQARRQDAGARDRAAALCQAHDFSLDRIAADAADMPLTPVPLPDDAPAS